MKQDTKLRVPIFDHVPATEELEAELGAVANLATAFRWSLSSWGSRPNQGPWVAFAGRFESRDSVMFQIEQEAKSRGFKIEYYEKKALLRVPVFDHVPAAAELEAEIGEVAGPGAAFRWSLAKWKSSWGESSSWRLNDARNHGLCLGFLRHGTSLEGAVGPETACPLYPCTRSGQPVAEFTKNPTPATHDAVLRQIERAAKERGFKIEYYRI